MNSNSEKSFPDRLGFESSSRITTIDRIVGKVLMCTNMGQNKWNETVNQWELQLFLDSM